MGRTYLFCLALLIIIMLCGFLLPLETKNNNKTNEIFGTQLNVLIKKLTDLKKSSKQKASLHILQKQFKESRLAYKKASTIIEYFYAYESKSLNGPALPRV